MLNGIKSIFNKQTAPPKSSKKKGFSLIEIIIVIAIMAVLVALLVPALIHYIEDSRASSDSHTMDEVVHAVEVGLAKPDAYSEMVNISVGGNVSCYIDSSSETGRVKNVTKTEEDGTVRYMFGDDEREKDGVPYSAAGNMQGVTITFTPSNSNGDVSFALKNAVVNKYVGGTNTLEQYPLLYENMRKIIGDTVAVDSQTYKNSEYTIFMVISPNKHSSEQDAVKIYGQYNGTNLPPNSTSGGITTDRNATIVMPEDRPQGPGGYNPGDPGYNPGGNGNSQACRHENPTTLDPVEATCQETGLTDGIKCFNCGRTLKAQQVTPRQEHRYGDWHAAGSYTHEKECVFGCGAKESASHSFGEPTKSNATCTEQGTAIAECTVCGYEHQEFSPATGHNWSAWGRTDIENCTRTCSKCNAVEKKAHIFVERGREKGPYCTDTTDITLKCSSCLAVFVRQEPSNFTSHKYESYSPKDDSLHEAHCTNGTCAAVDDQAHIFTTATIPASCGVQGIKRYTCSKCSHIVEEYFDALSHIDSDHNNKCDLCDITMATVALLGTGQNVTITAPVDLTWEEIINGKHYTVSDPSIQFSINRDVILAHGVSDPEQLDISFAAVQAAKTQKFGESTRYAVQVDVTSSTVLLYKQDHEHIIKYTGTNDQNHKVTCELSTCQFTQTLSHVFVKTDTLAPTCTEDGYDKFTCDDCGYVYTQTIKELKHKDENSDGRCDTCSKKLVVIVGIGLVATDAPTTDFSFDNMGNTVSGLTPMSDQTVVTPPEISSNKLPTIINFTFGKFDTKENNPPGSTHNVTYTNNTVALKNPKPYTIVEFNYWQVDNNDKITGALTPSLENFNFNNYSTWVVYNANSGRTKSLHGFTANSMLIYNIYYASDDTKENAMYLAAFLNKAENTTNYHVARWNGVHYVAQNIDSEIRAITEFTFTTSVGQNANVQAVATSNSKYVYIPIGSMKAEQGMTWRQWLASGYNTTGKISPVIKDSNFNDVSYDSVIAANKSYGFYVDMSYTLCGEWILKENININSNIYQELIFTTPGGDEGLPANSDRYDLIEINNSNKSIKYKSYVDDNEGTIYTASGGWVETNYRIINFGALQPVSKAFYDWINANAVRADLVNKTFASSIGGKTITVSESASITWKELIESGKLTSITIDGSKYTLSIKDGYIIYSNSIGTLTLESGLPRIKATDRFGDYSAYYVINHDNGSEIKYLHGVRRSTISFTIGDDECHALEGMSWTEWCNSQYNIFGYFMAYTEGKTAQVLHNMYGETIHNEEGYGPECIAGEGPTNGVMYYPYGYTVIAENVPILMINGVVSDDLSYEWVSATMLVITYDGNGEVGTWQIQGLQAGKDYVVEDSDEYYIAIDFINMPNRPKINAITK